MSITRTQCRLILDHMLAGFRVEPEFAKTLCGTTRLAARIKDIRDGIGVDRPYGDEIHSRYIEVCVNVGGTLKKTKVKE